MIELTSCESVEVPGRGTVHIIAEAGVDYPESLTGQEVVLDGFVVRVVAVEMALTAQRPYPGGLGIGLSVEGLRP